MDDEYDDDRQECGNGRARFVPPGGADGRRGRSTQGAGEEGGGDLPEFVADGEGEGGESVPLKRKRAPLDRVPYDADEAEGPCFASQFAEDEDASGSLGGEELKNAFREMNRLIDRYYANNTSNEDLVDAVHEFYESQIRRFYDYGAWSKKSIWRYITEHHSNSEERQAVDNIKTVYAQINFLREHVCLHNDVTGESQPDLRVIREIAGLCKLHSSLVTERKRRQSSK